MTYKSLMRSLMVYACPVWFPNACRSKIDKLRIIQNQALRIVTGCHVNASAAHLHAECELLMVRDHLNLLCAQYLASALRPDHINHASASAPSGPRRLDSKHRLSEIFMPLVEPYLTGGVVDPTTYPNVIKSLHTQCVQSSINTQPPNPILGDLPPVINREETSLPRTARTTLSQLRSNFCIRLNSYRQLISRSPNDVCPDCGNAPHTTSHLFSCTAFPTNLTTWDLWLRPREVVAFLSSHPSFDGILPPNPPPPPPPPEHPP